MDRRRSGCGRGFHRGSRGFFRARSGPRDRTNPPQPRIRLHLVRPSPRGHHDRALTIQTNRWENTQMKSNGNILIQTFLTVLAFCASIAAVPYVGAAESLPAAIKAGDAQLIVVLGANPSPTEKRV